MKLTGWKTTTAASAIAVLLGATFAACSSDDSTPSNTGGSANTGGTANTGGNAGTAGTGGGSTGGAQGTGGTIADSGSDACTCTGANCTSAGVLFSFDGADGGAAGTWDIYPPASADGGGVVPVQTTSTTEGKTAAGSLELTVPYTDFGQSAVSIQHNYGSSPAGGALNWSCKSALHVWVKVAPSGGDGGSVTSFINGVQAYIQSGDPDPDAAIMGGYTRYTATFVNGSMFADGMFHEIVVPFGTGAMAVNPIDVNQIGVQVLPLGAAPDGGGATPGTVTLFIDDITLQ